MDGSLFRGLLFLFLLPGLANADAVNGEWYSTTRALSMGNVGIASADDPTTSAFYNPAALARTKKTTLEIYNPQLEMGGGTFSVSRSIADWAKITSFSASRPLLAKRPGTPASMGYAIFPNVNSQNFSFGVLMSGQTASYYNARTDSYYHHSRQLLIPSFGISASLLGGRLRIGAAVRGVQISEANVVSLGPAATATAIDNTRSGFGVGLDGGLLMTMPWAGLPTIGGVVHNVGDTAFPSAPLVIIGGSSGTRHESAKMTYDGGFSVSPKLGKKDQLTFAVDYRDALNVTNTSTLRKTNAGIELSMSKILYFRAGYSQAYWTAGFGLSSKNGSLDLGSYGEELSNSLHGMQDRRYTLRLTRRF